MRAYSVKARGGKRTLVIIRWLTVFFALLIVLQQYQRGRTDAGKVPLQATFEQIYKDQAWGPRGKGSGDGSTINSTAPIRAILKQVIEKYNVQALIDAPCGAMAWMPTLLHELEVIRPGFKYLGLEIAQNVVTANMEQFANETTWEFRQFDLTSERLPDGYDLIHTRDALQHLSCSHVVDCLQNLALSSAKHLLVGSYDTLKNADIPDGAYFRINLRKPPYSLEPQEVYDERYVGKRMLFFNTTYLRAQDYGSMKARCKEL